MSTYTIERDIEIEAPVDVVWRVVETGLDQLDWPDADKQKFVDEHRHGWQERGDALRDLFVAGHASSPRPTRTRTTISGKRWPIRLAGSSSISS
jgi:hypothetical protein